MSVPDAPSSLVAQTNGDSTYIDLTWTNVVGGYIQIEIQYKVSVWHTLTNTYDGSKEYYNNFPANPNTTYTFRVRGGTIGFWSDWSNEASATCWSTSPSTSMSMVPGATDSVESVETEFEIEVGTSMRMLPLLTTSNAWTTTASVTMSMVPLVSEIVTTQQDYEYYLADDAGNVFEFSGDYLGDAGAEIPSQFISKNTDFADQDQDCFDRYKTVHNVKLYYKDKSSSTDVTVALSVDNGTNWVTATGGASQTLGDGSDEIKTATFWFLKTSQFFQFKISHGSADKSFQWLGIECEYSSRSDYFSSS